MPDLKCLGLATLPDPDAYQTQGVFAGMVTRLKAPRPGVVARLRCGFGIVVTRLLIFSLLISNFSEEIIYKIAQIKKFKRTINLLHIQYFLFLQHSVSIKKFKFFFYDHIFQIFVYTNSYNVE
jgi:hypothetical protein